jgi:hypothetical protein
MHWALFSVCIRVYRSIACQVVDIMISLVLLLYHTLGQFIASY